MYREHNGVDGMTNNWKHIRPLDKYMVRISTPLNTFELKIINQLYQPLTGSLAYALYMTLISELEGDYHVTRESLHRHLMHTMNVSLDQIYRARLRLEAIGLLNTYTVRMEEEFHLFEYELHPPLRADKFFSDDILSIYLYNQVGAQQYKQLRARFSTLMTTKERPNNGNKEDITQEFHEVFTSLHASELVAKKGSELQRELEQLQHEYPLPDGSADMEGTPPSFERFTVDIDVLKSFMMKGLDLDQVLTPGLKEELKKVAFFYRLDEYQLSRLIHDSLNQDEQIELFVLKEQAKKWYRLQHGGQPPHILHMVQAPQKSVMDKKSLTTEEDQHLYTLENLSPLRLLEEYQGGGKVAEADVKLLEELLFDYQLEPGVVNILLEYILMTNDFKLPKKLVTKVAAHWKRLKITDIRQAQQVALKEHQQYKEWQGRKAQPENKKEENGNTAGRKASSQAKQPSGFQNKNVRRDKLPKWIENPPASDASSPISNEQKKKRIESLLKDLGEWDD